MQVGRWAWCVGALVVLAIGWGVRLGAESVHDARGEALRLYIAGRYQEALPFFDEVLKHKPHDIELRNKRGCIYIRLNQPERALEDFDESSRPSAFLAYDAMHLDRQFYPDVQVNRTPGVYGGGQVYVSAVTNRGIALLMLGRDDEARAAFERSIALRLAYPASYASNARRAWRVGLASAYCGLGQVHHRKGNEVQALEAYDQAIAYNPDDPNGYVGRGAALTGLGRFDQALLNYNVALRLDPNHSRALGLRATALERLGHDREALADYDATIRIDPNAATARRMRGALLSKLGKHDQALAEFDAAVALDPKDSGAYKDRGAVYSQSGDYAKALRDLDEALRLDPKNAKAYQNRAATFNELGQFERAIRDCDEALRINPKNAGARNNRGLALLGLGQYEQAISSLTEALALDARLVPAYVNRGGAFTRLGLIDEASADYEEALRLAPHLTAVENGLRQIRDLVRLRSRSADDSLAVRQVSPESQHFYDNGNARRASGDWSGAVAEYGRAIESDPKNADAYAMRGWSSVCAGLPGAEADARAWLDLKGWREPFSPYIALLGVLAARQAKHDVVATAFLDEALANARPTDWPAPLFRYLKRTMPSWDLIAAADAPDRLTEARAVIGLDLLYRGERSAAAEHLRWVRDHGDEGSIARDLAVEALRRVEAGGSKETPADNIPAPASNP
jgi:tetratricopeptide (TPR) repeat protein